MSRMSALVCVVAFVVGASVLGEAYLCPHFGDHRGNLYTAAIILAGTGVFLTALFSLEHFANRRRKYVAIEAFLSRQPEPGPQHQSETMPDPSPWESLDDGQLILDDEAAAALLRSIAPWINARTLADEANRCTGLTN